MYYPYHPMYKADVAKRLAGKLGVSQRDARNTLDAVIAVFGDALSAGHTIQLTGIGTFAPKTKPERTVTNPATGQKMIAAKKRTVRFRPGKHLLDRMNDAKYE